MQESEPPADKRQRLLCTSAASAACSTTTGIPVGVALHESIAIACVPSVLDQNQLLPKPSCLGYLPDVYVPAPFVHNWAFAAQNLCIHCYFSANCGLRVSEKGA